MIKHLVKIVWNRKRTNFLIIVEIFFSFLVLFAVTLFAVYYTDNYRHPLGFAYDNVWNVGIERSGGSGETSTSTEVSSEEAGAEQAAQEAPATATASTDLQLYMALREFGEVEAIAGAQSSPYTFSTSQSGYELNGRPIEYQVNQVTDSFKDVMKLTLVRGRWFGKEDDGANYNPVVINEHMSREVFGDEDPIGKSISPDADQMGAPVRMHDRVVGVITDFRKDGEFAALGNYVFQRNDVHSPKAMPQANFLIRVRPGTTAAFEEELMNRMQAIAKDWSFEIQPVGELKEAFLRVYIGPILAAALIAGFLLLMVALGLTGVLWQNVTQRIREIGLRRAKGATARNIYTQILGELVLIASFGLIAGALVVAQFPLLGLTQFISGKVYAYSLAVSLSLIYLLTVLCGLYPSRLATRINPAEALHYE